RPSGRLPPAAALHAAHAVAQAEGGGGHALGPSRGHRVELRARRAEEAAVGADPERARRVLQDAVGGVVEEARLLVVDGEVAALQAGPAAAGGADPEHAV